MSAARSSRSDEVLVVVSRVDFGLLFVAVFVVVVGAVVMIFLLDLRCLLLFVNVFFLLFLEGVTAAGSSSRFLFRRRRKNFEVPLADFGGENGERVRITLSSV